MVMAQARTITVGRKVSVTAHGLIDTTEMYLRTVFELEEEGIVPLRARIAERLAQSGPTVSQTVARMERDGLLHVAGDRQLALTEFRAILSVKPDYPQVADHIKNIEHNFLIPSSSAVSMK